MWACLGGLGVGLALPTVAHAQSNPTVTVVIAPGDAPVGVDLAATARELLGRLHAHAATRSADAIDPVSIVRPPPVLDDVLARVWIDVRDPTRATLYLVDATWSRVLVRHFARTPGSDPALIETVGHTLEAAVEALLSGGVIGIDRHGAERELLGPVEAPAVSSGSPAPAPMEPTVLRSPLPPWRLRLEAALGYEAAGYSNEAPLAQGPSLDLLGAFVVGRVRLGATVGGQLAFPVAVTGEGVVLELDAMSLRGAVVAGWQASPALAVDVSVGARTQLCAVHERSAGAGVATTASETLAFGAARALAAVRWRVAGPVGVVAGVGMEAEFNDNRFVAETPHGERDVLVPWRVHPLAVLAVTFGSEFVPSR